MSYRGRFAPSPTGQLHFGSVLAAMVSYLRAREQGGVWLVRMEDLDPPREVPGAAQAILTGLERLGFVSDEPVVYQSQRGDLFQSALKRLLDEDRAFWCGCTRKELPTDGVYPGTCAQGIPAGKHARSVRLRVPEQPVHFSDVLRGECEYDLKRLCGDFIIRRGDGLIAYQLGVVVDDIEQSITEVVRGSDLLDSTPRQILIYRALGAETPAWMHLPVAVNQLGRKLSKQTFARPVSNEDPLELLPRAWAFLGLPPMPRPTSVSDFWQRSEARFHSDEITREREIPYIEA
jgi:glutamyl-Q tRNA(Asp) synthetase